MCINNCIIRGEELLSLAHFLLVEKSWYIRMVHDGTFIGLNKVLWDPYLTLPTMSTEMISIKLGTNMGGSDIRNLFLTS